MAQRYHWKVPCTICEGPAEYHCNTCGDVLCSKCRKNHLKSNAGRNHDVHVVSYAQRIESKTKSLQCGDHPKHLCKMWCQACNRSICGDCATSPKHRGHRFLQLDEKIGDRRKKVQDQFSKYSSLLTQWQTSLKELEKLKEGYEEDVRRIDQDIIDQADELCRQVRRFETYSRNELKRTREDSLRILWDNQKSLTEGVHHLKSKTKLLEDALRAEDTLTILQGPVEETSNTKSSLDRPPRLPVLSLGSINIEILKKMSVTLTETSVSSVQVNVVQNYENMALLADPSVDLVISMKEGLYTPAVSCVGSGQAWVQTAIERLQLVDRQGAIKRTINIDFYLHDMAMTPQGDILLPYNSNKCIQTMSLEGEIKHLFTTEWPPYGLCCLPAGDVVVTFNYDQRVVQYTSTGKVIMEMDRSLFQNPWYVAHGHDNKQLYICDKSSPNILDSTGRVLALDMNGRLQYTYFGSDSTTFSPLAVNTDQTGHVLITDLRNNKIHILDRGGNFLQYLLTGEGLTRPTTIDVDDGGFAWIGEWDTGKLKLVRYRNRKMEDARTSFNLSHLNIN